MCLRVPSLYITDGIGVAFLIFFPRIHACCCTQGSVVVLSIYTSLSCRSKHALAIIHPMNVGQKEQAGGLCKGARPRNVNIEWACQLAFGQRSLKPVHAFCRDLPPWPGGKDQRRSRHSMLQHRRLDISSPPCACGNLRQGNVDGNTWDLINVIIPKLKQPAPIAILQWGRQLAFHHHSQTCSCFLHRLVNPLQHLNPAIHTCAPNVCVLCVALHTTSVFMLCGDVELNPGPSSEQILGELLQEQKEKNQAGQN